MTGRALEGDDVRPATLLAAAGFLAFSSLSGPAAAQTQPPEIALTLKHGPGPLDVTLEWTGGQPTFEVFRSGDMKDVCGADDSLGVTDARTWFDLAPPGTVFYRVHGASAAEPPETCNGADDNCNGIIDDDAIGCDAGACELCVGGTCRSRCGACDDCVDGACRTRCGPCQICSNGACASCDAGACQTCINGVCQVTCDETRCLVCAPGGTCVSACAACETCLDGVCLDDCDRDQCLSCQSGVCRPFCDPVCQTCTPLGCLDTCGPCERCVGGVCHPRCDPGACEACVDGMCRSRCAEGETCVGGVCGGSSGA
ncbi:MAG: hypothetical protein ACRD6R_03390 [Candidatus Polarisedimenticolia bacterium]